MYALASTATERASLDVSWQMWAALFGVLTAFILLDLFVLNRGHQIISMRRALIHTLMWIGVGVLVGGMIWYQYGTTAGQEYYAGWLIEYSLSIDNVFVWSLIFTCFAVPAEYRHRVLFWGIFGALVLRLTFIAAGVTLIERFAVVIVLLGGFLLWSGSKIIFQRESEKDISTTWSYRFFTKAVRTAEGRAYGAQFFVRQDDGKLYATYLFVCLLVIEMSDVMFAVDSVPAILAVARDPFIVFASNAMAIMGLRSLFFLFDRIKDKFVLLKYGLGAILCWVGVKMVISSDIGPLPGIHLPTVVSLMVIGVALGVSILASLWYDSRTKRTKAASVKAA